MSSQNTQSSRKKANTKKVSVGALPDQRDDYSEYEETEVLWGRLTLIFTSVVGTAFIALYALFYPANHGAETASVLEERQAEKAEQKILASTKAPESSAVVAAIEEVADNLQVAAPAKEINAEVVTKVEDLESLADPSTTAAADQVNLLTVLKPKEAKAVAVVNTSNALISPVSTLHPGIRVASLAKGIDAKRKPVDLLGYQVAMQDEGLIKVVLYTEMQDIRGVTLYHEWYQGDKRRAKVRIPVTGENQASFSSKYIDRHMMGEWTVRVRDEQGEMYAMANFNVVK